MSDELARMILEVVMQVPYGKVATYGQIAAMAGLPRHARLVGRVLHQLDEENSVPWHRIVNAQGKISLMKLDMVSANLQEQKLALEKIEVINGKVNLKKYQWQL